MLGPQTVPDTSRPHVCLWNTEGFFALRDASAGDRVVVEHEQDGRLVGTFVFGWEERELVSGFSAPFGGPDFVRQYEPVAGVVQLLRAAVEEAASLGAESVRVRLKPPHYGEPGSHLQFVMAHTGFVVDRTDLNYFLDLQAFADVDAYTAALKPQTRRAIKHALAADLSCDLAPVDDDGTWLDAYEVLRDNRVQKGRPMRLPFEYVARLRDAFPDIARMLVCRTKEGTVCAAALLYRIAAGHDVVQYWGDAHHELPHSPMPVLVQAVVDHSLATGGRFLDLGISTDHGVPNHGLIQFKRSIGAVAEIRVELVGRLDAVVDHPGWSTVGG